jgi:hypothetical protein
MEKALLHFHHAARDLHDTLGNGPAIHWLKRGGFQNQQVESALDEASWFTQTETPLDYLH